MLRNDDYIEYFLYLLSINYIIIYCNERIYSFKAIIINPSSLITVQNAQILLTGLSVCPLELVGEIC